MKKKTFEGKYTVNNPRRKFSYDLDFFCVFYTFITKYNFKWATPTYLVFSILFLPFYPIVSTFFQGLIRIFQRNGNAFLKCELLHVRFSHWTLFYGSLSPGSQYAVCNKKFAHSVGLRAQTRSHATTLVRLDYNPLYWVPAMGADPGCFSWVRSFFNRRI